MIDFMQQTLNFSVIVKSIPVWEVLWFLSVICVCSFDADMDDMDEDEPVDDIENPEVWM